jgi:hypothetical protein
MLTMEMIIKVKALDELSLAEFDGARGHLYFGQSSEPKESQSSQLQKTSRQLFADGKRK